MYGGNRSSYKSSYDFVHIGRREIYDSGKAPKFSGYIDLKLICISDIHIGSGYRSFVGKGRELVNETLRSAGKPIIPGSSFKGAVRAVAAAASNSCSPGSPKCNAGERCIVCDMFGTMGFASKIIFPDLHSDNAKLKVEVLNSQFSPKDKYFDDDGKPCGYKFYMTGDNDYDNNNKVKAEIIEYNSEFSGRILFKKLTEEQLSLLMFSLGLNGAKDETINLKIGGFKNEGMGEVHTEAISFKADGLKKTPAELAEEYKTMDSANLKGIDDILYILQD